MSYERKAIRCYIATKLRGRTAAGEKVYTSRVAPHVPQVDGPIALTVYTLSEDVATHADTPRSYARSLELAVELFLEQSAGRLEEDALDELLDDVAEQVECVVEPELPQLAGLELEDGSRLSIDPSRSGLRRLEVGFDARGRELAGAVRLVWTVVYGTDVDERAQAQARDLHGARVRYRFPPPAERLGDDAVDDVDTSGA